MVFGPYTPQRTVRLALEVRPKSETAFKRFKNALERLAASHGAKVTRPRRRGKPRSRRGGGK